MKFIGITGGVGAGKSAILEYLSKKEGIRVMLADEIAHDLMKPGTACYKQLKKEFAAEDIYLPEGGFDRMKLAKIIFSEEEKRNRLNGIVHPAVKQYVIKEAAKERENPERKMLVLEAALLIEEHYDAICDELWYIYTREEIRQARLMESRGYSREKVRQIFDSQLQEEVYRKHCTVVIDNNKGLKETYFQLEEAISNLESEEK